jgi:MFS family permease
LFLAVHGIVLLFAARVLQGVAVSAASSALRAALIKLQPGRGGLARRSPAQSPPLTWERPRWGASVLVQTGRGA